MRKLFLVRGLPGSGKSTLAKTLAPVHCEADQYFVGPDGVYRFDQAKLAEAHADCLTRTVQALCDGRDVAVSNTFTRVWEMRPYLDLRAKIEGLEIEVVRMTSQYESVHGVPKEAVDRMRQRFEDFPGETLVGPKCAVSVIT